MTYKELKFPEGSIFFILVEPDLSVLICVRLF